MTIIGRNARSGRSTRIGRAAVTPNPATIFGASLLQWCRADQGVTIVSGASQWDDLSGNARHYTQANTAAQPAYGATAGPNGTPALIFDGVDDNMRALTLTRPVPGTTPTWIWLVVKQLTWSNGDRFFSAGNSSSTLCLVQSGGSPGLQAYNATNSAVVTGLAVGVWGAVTTYFSNSVLDYLQVNDGAPATGISLGNNGASTSMVLGSGNNTLFGNIAVSDIVYTSILPSAKQISDMATYRFARYLF